MADMARADMARGAEHDFWRPPIDTASETFPPVHLQACQHCRTEFIVGSRYCHNCGATRPALDPSRSGRAGVLDFVLGEHLGLSTPSLVAFFAGIICLIGALTAGWVSSYGSVPDWAAIQTTRIEWLLAAISAFVAGCLLKPRN